MAKVVSVLSACVVAVIVAFAVAPWLNRQLDSRARAVFASQAQVHRARVYEEIAPLPPELRESSGIAVSRTQPGVLWSHNDSGDSPTLYALDISARLLAKVSVANAIARDWEDLAYGLCPGDTSSSKTRCLYIADTGNNDRQRDFLTIYVVPEPVITGGVDTSKPVVAIARSLRFRYPDQNDDAEALALSPTGALTIVTKGRTGSIRFYGLSPGIVGRALTGETVTAEYEGDSGIPPDQRIGRWVTASAMAPDGKTLAVRTYSEIYLFARSSGPGNQRWMKVNRSCFLGDVEPQGEAIDYLDADTFIVTSETAQGRQGWLRRVVC